MATLSLTAQAELPLNQRYQMYDRNGPTYNYNSDSSAHYTGRSSTSHSTQPANFLPYSITTSNGNFTVIPNATTGRVQAVIQTSRGK
jgi:hypothetical protein